MGWTCSSYGGNTEYPSTEACERQQLKLQRRKVDIMRML